MAVHSHDGRRSLGALLREMAEGSATLFRREIQLARMELEAAAAGIGRGSALMALGGALLLLGGLALLAGIVLLLGDQWLPKDLYWLAALIVMVITGAIALWFARRGMTVLSPSNLSPGETVTTLKEDKEWLKQRLTSGVTSN